MTGHAWSALEVCALIMYLYMLLSAQIGFININKDKTRPIQVFYTYQTSNTVKIDKIGQSTKATPTKPFETNRKVLIGIRMAYDIWVAIMLISLANDIETHPGPSMDSGVFSKMPVTRGLKIGHLDVRSLIHKMDVLNIFIRENPFDIFTVSETWLTSSIIDSEVNLSGYSIVRKDRRTNKRGGDVAIFVKNMVSRTDI